MRRKLKEEEMNHVAIWEKAVQALGTASAKALRWGGKARKPLRLEPRGKMRPRDEVRSGRALWPVQRGLALTLREAEGTGEWRSEEGQGQTYMEPSGC